MGPSLLTLVLLTGATPIPPNADVITVLERNHCFDRATGQQRFVQLIHWNRYGRSLHVAHWEMDHDQYVLYPAHDACGKSYRMICWRGSQVRVFKVNRFIETYTFIDPEVNDRLMLPVVARRGLP